MSKNRLMESIRCCSGPALFLAGACMMMNILFLVLDSGVGWIFVVAGGAALTVFGLLGARGGDGPALRRLRLPAKRG